MYYQAMGADQLEGFKLKKMVKRMTKVTPKSFTFKKIMGAIGSVTATVATSGLGPIVAPKIFSANSSTMKALGMGVSAIAVVAGGVVIGPAVAASLGPALSSAAGLVGKAVTGMTGFMGAFNKLLPQHQQQLADTLTAQQIADVEQGRAVLDQSTGTLTYTSGAGGAYPPGYAPSPQAPIFQSMPGTADGGSQPGQGQAVASADMLGGVSPLMLGVLIGVPLVFQMMKGRR